LEIQSISPADLKRVKKFYADITNDLQKKGINQWDRFYPNRFILKADLQNHNLYGIKQNEHLVAAIVLDTNESKQYKDLHWEDTNGSVLIIHRLGIHPKYQGKGIAKKMLQFAEDFAEANGYTSIRLDVFSENQVALTMYEHAGYQERGIIRFPFRAVPYTCFEKLIG
jgi:ribosomal protein S18 acetylase RimI-like enzyme